MYSLPATDRALGQYNPLQVPSVLHPEKIVNMANQSRTTFPDQSRVLQYISTNHSTRNLLIRFRALCASKFVLLTLSYLGSQYHRRRKILGDPEVTANIYCKSRNLPNMDTQNYSTDLR